MGRGPGDAGGWPSGNEGMPSGGGRSNNPPGGTNAAAVAEPADTPLEARPYDFVLAIYLEADRPGDTFSYSERALDSIVQHMQPSPAITHVELLIPAHSGADSQHFSTYLGTKGADWSTGYGNGMDFYLNPKGNGGSWRAVPIFSIDAVDRVRTECHDHVHTPYPSMSRLLNYPFSVPPLRAFAGWLDDQPGTPAHCAALTARILRRAVPEVGLPNPSAWYGPSTLYLELTRRGRMVAYGANLANHATLRSLVDDERAVSTLDALLRGSDDDLRQLGEADTTAAINLACKQCVDASIDGDAVLIRKRQKELARAALRDSWVARPARLAHDVVVAMSASANAHHERHA